MRSGTSFFDGTVFKKTIVRFWPLWGAYFAGWLIAMPLSGLMVLRMDSRYSPGLMNRFAMSTVPAMGAAGARTLSVIFGVLAAMAVFSHLYNTRSANLFGSLPIRREGLFLTHYLAGLSFLVVPNAVVFLLTLLVEAAGGCVGMQGLLFWLAAACGECLLFYSMAVFCGLFTGHILALPAFYAVFNFIVFGVTELLHMVFQAFYYGFDSFTEGVYTVVKWFTPMAQLETAVWCNSYVSYGDTESGRWVLETYGWGTLGAYAVAAVVLTACAFLLYRSRRLESAGDVVSVRAMRPVFRYGVALCAGLVFGIATVLFTGGGEATLMIAIVVWGVIGCFAAQMLLDKSFKVFHKWKGAAAVTAVFVAMFLVVGFDLTGFETRIPSPDSVECVSVSGINAVGLGDSGDWLEEEITDPDIIGLLAILHREAVAQRDEERQTQAQLGGVSTSLKLAYTLKGGGTLARRYTVWLDPGEADQEGTAAWAIQQIYDNRELFWQAYGFAQLEENLAQGWRLESAGYGGYDEAQGYYEEAFYSRDAAALLAAVKEDFFAGRIGVRRVDGQDGWNYGGRDETVSFSAVGVGDDGENRYFSVEIALQDTASSTLAALEGMAGQTAVDDLDGYRE